MPNTQPMYAVSFRHEMSGSYFKILTILTTDTLSLPSKITAHLSKDTYYFDDSDLGITPKEFRNYGIFNIFSVDGGEIYAETAFEGQNLLVKVKGYDSDYYTYSWDIQAGKYNLIEKKTIKSDDIKFYEMQYAAKSGNIEQLYTQLENFDYGGVYGAPFERFPKSLSNDIWIAVHKKALSMYKKGNKKEAARLITKLIELVYVDTHRDNHTYDYDYISYNYVVESLMKDARLVAQISDCAFFLEQGSISYYLPEAVGIFEEIIKQFPNRLVTPLNLGDTYWKLGRVEKAKTN